MSSSSRRVAIFGAGFVAPPLVRRLLEDRSTEIVVAADTHHPRVVRHAEAGRIELVTVDATRPADVEPLVAGCDVAVSLLPARLHGVVARACIDHRKPLVTTSYAKGEIEALDRDASEAGIPLLMECGLDPGLDHMIAMRMIDELKGRGGTVSALRSYAGGLPAPESNDNPWGYKFSWNPRGVLLGATRPSRFLEEGEKLAVPGGELFEHRVDVTFPDLGRLEAYPNGDALKYLDSYRIEDAQTSIRGTLRYPGHCATWKLLVQFGFLSEAPFPGGERPESHAALTARAADAKGSPASDPREAFARAASLAPDADPLERMAWLGLFDPSPLPSGAKSPLDVVLARMSAKMQYAAGERDLIAMEVILEGTDERGAPLMLISRLVRTGDALERSAMSETVGLPAAEATLLVLDGRLDRTGVVLPVTRDVYEPILTGIERGAGIEVDLRVHRPDES